MSRLKAFSIHFGISLLIFVVLTYLVVIEWYPGILFEADGGWRGMRIIMGVDLVLGPLLTFIVFRAGKPGLKFDLTCIGLLQTVCLIAGSWVVWSERPLAIVYVDSRFEVTTQDGYDEAGQAANLERFSDEKPIWVMVDLPTDLDELAEIRREAYKGGVSLALWADRYRAFDPSDPLFTEDSRDLEVIIHRDGGQSGLDAWLDEHGGSIDDYAFYTFATRYAYRYIGFRKNTGENLGFLDVQPR